MLVQNNEHIPVSQRYGVVYGFWAGPSHEVVKHLGSLAITERGITLFRWPTPALLALRFGAAFVSVLWYVFWVLFLAHIGARLLDFTVLVMAIMLFVFGAYQVLLVIARALLGHPDIPKGDAFLGGVVNDVQIDEDRHMISFMVSDGSWVTAKIRFWTPRIRKQFKIALAKHIGARLRPASF
ncbi:MAG: hypothetical protein AMS16_04725 [Planctomycetes bacterium DG_58]|nr:MAG: hypothetical protein AMS16_04725 [Planctomycetes bacterium DG_58]